MSDIKKTKGKRVGKEIADRMGRFVKKLKSSVDYSAFNARSIKLNLEPQSYSAELVKKTRKSLNASQSIFAKFIGVSLSTVQDWEQGLKPPRGSACRLMDEIRLNPEYWKTRLRKISVPV